MGSKEKNNLETKDSKQNAVEKQHQLELERKRHEEEVLKKAQERALKEAREKEAIEKQKEAAELLRQKNSDVQPITIKNNDGSTIAKDNHGRVSETQDSNGQKREFTYNDNGELNSFTENGNKWSSTDGSKWECPGEKARIMRAVVNPEDGTFANVEANSKIEKLSNIKTEAGKIKEATSAGGIKQTFGYNGTELNSFTDDQSNQWNSTDGKNWKADGLAERTMKVAVNAADGTLTITQAATTKLEYLSGETKILDATTDKPANLESKKDTPVNKAAMDTAAHSIYATTDIKKLSDILEPMSEAERQQVKLSYKEFYNKDLQTDLDAKLYKSDAAQCEALLKRKDGVVDFTGQIHQAKAKLDEIKPWDISKTLGFAPEISDGQMRSERQIRDSISSLNTEQFKTVKDKYSLDYGRDLESDLLNSDSISTQTKELLKVYFKGKENRTDADTLRLSEYSLKERRPDLFNELMKNASSTAREQFKAQDGYKKIDAAHTDDEGLNSADAQISKDYLERGCVSLATIALGDTHWYHTNKEDISRTMSNASDQDRKDFERGEQLKASNQTPTTVEDQRALNFYNAVDSGLRGAGSEREVAQWEAQIRNRQSVLTNALSSRYEGWWITGLGAATDQNKLFGSVENMSKEDWQYLREHKEELQVIDKGLQTFPDSHREDVMKMLNTKLAAESYEISKTVGNRDLEQHLLGSTDANSKMAAIESMSTDERQRYLTNKDGFKDKIDKFFPYQQERYILSQIAQTEPGKTNSTVQVLIDGVTVSNPATTFDHMEKAFRDDPTLKERLKNPQNDADKNLNLWFHNAFNSAVEKSGHGPRYFGTKTGEKMVEGSDATRNQYAKAMFEDGHVPLDTKILLTADKLERVNIILRAPEAEKQMLLNKNPDEAGKKFQDAVLGEAGEREVILQALAQKNKDGTTGMLTEADRFRMFALKMGGEQSEMKEKLSRMPAEERQGLANEYFTKYHRLITADVIDKVDEDDKWRFRELLSPTDIDVRQIALDSQRSVDSHTSDWDPILKQVWDYSRVSADASQEKLNKFVVEHADEIDKLSPEKRKQFDDAVRNFSAAQKGYIDSKGEFADAFVDATITVAAIGGACFTGGTSLALLTAIGAGGAVYKIAVKKSIQGSDFDSSAKNIFKQGFEGGSTAVLSFLGPEALGLKGIKVGEALAQQTAKKLLIEQSTAKLFKEGSEEILKNGLSQVSREGAIIGEKQITALAEKVAGEGVDRALVEQTIRNQLKNDVTKGLRNKLVNETESYVKNVAAAQIGDSGKQILSTAVGLESPETLLERLGNSSVSTVAGVTMFHFSFRAAVGGKKMIGSLGRDGDTFIAGEGTTIQHADGQREVVPEGKTLKLAKDDRIAETDTIDAAPINKTSTTDKPEVEDGAFDHTITDINFHLPTDLVGNAIPKNAKYLRLGRQEFTLLPDGPTVEIGRRQVGSATKDNASYNPYGQVHVGLNAQGKPYIATNLSNTDHTFIKLKGSKEWSKISTLPKDASHGGVIINYGDQVRLGYSGESNLDLSELTQANFKIGNTEVNLAPGQRKLIGRGDIDSADLTISSKHLSVGLDRSGRTYIYEEPLQASTNGTFIRRQGSTEYVRITPGAEVHVLPGDEIRLGPTTHLDLSNMYREVNDVVSPELTRWGRLKKALVGSEKEYTAAMVRTNEGTLRYRDNRGLVEEYPNGSKIITDYSGAKITEEGGRITRMVDAKGSEYKYEYNNEKISRVWFGNESYDSTYGEWTVAKDGTLHLSKHLNSGGRIEQYYRPDGTGDLAIVNSLKGARFTTSKIDLRIEEFKVNQLAEIQIHPDDLPSFRGLLRELKASRLTNEQQGEVLHQINRMLADDPKSVLKSAERAVIAQQALQQTLDYRFVDQGQRPTCALASLEKKIINEHPKEYLRLVADSVTTGKYVASDGTVVDAIEINAIKFDDEADRVLLRGLPRPYKRVDDSHRSWASQIFQQVIVNTHLKDNADGFIFKNRGGHEALVDQDNKTVLFKHGDIFEKAHSPRIGKEEQYESMFKKVTGQEQKFLYKASGDAPIAFNNQPIHNPAILAESMVDTLNQGVHPIAAIDVRNSPFWELSGRGEAGGAGGATPKGLDRRGHAIMIKEIEVVYLRYQDGSIIHDISSGKPIIDTNRSKVTVMNTWGRQADNVRQNQLTGQDTRISVQELYNSMHNWSGIE